VEERKEEELGKSKVKINASSREKISVKTKTKGFAWGSG